MIDKEKLREQILLRLQHDYTLQLRAAKTAHEAATHEECAPNSKYETLALEASYIAQGQANRAQEILKEQQQLKQMNLEQFSEDSAIRLSAIVELLDEEGSRHVFMACAAGGLEVEIGDVKLMVITPASPLGRELIGKQCGDFIEFTTNETREYEIVAVY